MVESRLIDKKNKLELQLKRGIRDPKKKLYALECLLALERDIARMGWDKGEIEKNEFLPTFKRAGQNK